MVLLAGHHFKLIFIRTTVKSLDHGRVIWRLSLSYSFLLKTCVFLRFFVSMQAPVILTNLALLFYSYLNVVFDSTFFRVRHLTYYPPSLLVYSAELGAGGIPTTVAAFLPLGGVIGYPCGGIFAALHAQAVTIFFIVFCLQMR